MDMSAYQGFTGRIGRKTWWIASIILAIAATVLSFILMAIFGGSMMGAMEGGLTADVLASTARKLAIVQIILLALIAYPATALMMKRLNDRDRPSTLVYAFWAPTVLSILVNLLGLGVTTTEVNGVAMPAQSSLGTIVGLLGFAVGIWALIELGILKGTDGPNQHGPDPVAAR